MGFLKSLFGPNKEVVWRELADQLERGDYVERGFLKGSKVQARSGDWIVTLDTHTESTGNSSQTYTRMRAPFVNRDDFEVSISRAGFFSELGRSLFGLQDIEVGHPRFDDAFVIRGNSLPRVRALFQNSRIRSLIEAQPRISMKVKDDEGWFHAHFPDGVDELYFEVSGVLKDIDRLRGLFDLFSEFLGELCHGDSAYENDLDLLVERLRDPGGVIEGEVLLWEGDPPRRRAAEELGRMRDPRAVPALAEVLYDEDVVLRRRAVLALGEIGDVQAVPALLPIVGISNIAEGETLARVAARTLVKLGEVDLVDAYAAALGGDSSALRSRGARYRAELTQALMHTLESPVEEEIVRAAEALADWGAIHALPNLRKAVRTSLGGAPSACRAAVRVLEARAALPRPAQLEGKESSLDTLPRATGAQGPDTDTLPRPSDESASDS